MHQFKITDDQSNKYLEQGLTKERCLELAGDWKDELPAPWIWHTDTHAIIDDSHTGVGTKGRWADLLVSQVETDEMVYVQPRCGWAGISLCHLAKKHGKKLTLFMPAAAKPSEHQLVTIERGASPIFVKIPAMPVLNKYAKDYADEKGATFLPFGLDHPLVVAAGVASTLQWAPALEPERMWSVVSTGVLTRTLQIVWPNTTFYGVAVARNLQPGEIGRAEVVSYHRPFSQPSTLKDCPVDSAVNYDMKGIEYFFQVNHLAWFWNVAGEVHPDHLMPEDVDSQRSWGERR